MEPGVCVFSSILKWCNSPVAHDNLVIANTQSPDINQYYYLSADSTMYYSVHCGFQNSRRCSYFLLVFLAIVLRIHKNKFGRTT